MKYILGEHQALPEGMLTKNKYFIYWFSQVAGAKILSFPYCFAHLNL